MKNNKGFTLIEVMVVMVIIGILTAAFIFKRQDINYQAEIANGKEFALSLLTSLPANFVSEWKFDGPTAAGSAAVLADAKDTWGANDASAISNGVVVRGGVDCISGNCLEFDGNDDFITIPDNDSLDLNGNYTISFWAYNGVGIKSYPTLFNRAAQSSSNGFFWCYTGGTDEVNVLYQWSSGSSYSSVSFANVFKPNLWTFFVFTFDNSSKTLKLYKNGVYTNDPKTLTSALPVDDGNLYIGTYGGLTSNYPFKGKIDEFRVFNDVLPISWIENEYFAGLNKLLITGSISKGEYIQRIGMK